MISEIEKKYREKLLLNQRRAEVAMKKVYMDYVNNVTRYLNDPSLKFSKSFTLKHNELLATILSGQEYTALKAGMYEVTKDSISGAWTLASQQTGEAFKGYATLLEKFAGKTAASMDVNRKALAAFIRGRGTTALSERVWTASAQFRDEMAVHLGMGIANGDSAATVSRRVRQYLNEPDKLFRKVKYTGKDGVTKLRWSKRAQQYHPGRGVYRSSYMNAMRVTRTETNQAFWAAKQQNWRTLKFVTGYRVSLSSDHPAYDICDALVGEYPKGFYFTGWHPHCMCHITPILMSESNFKKYLSGQSVKERRIGLPNNFVNWLQKNSEKIAVSKKLPFFMQDNITQPKPGSFAFLGNPIPTTPAAPPPPIALNSATGFKEAATLSEAIEQMEAYDVTISPMNKINIKTLNEVNQTLAELKTTYDSDGIRLTSFTGGGKKLEQSYAFAGRQAIDQSRISLNENWFNNKTKLIKSLTADVDSQYHPPGCNTIKSIIDHEFAHCLTRKWIQPGSPLLKQFENIQTRYAAQLKAESLSGKYAWRSKNPIFISGYAEKNLAEFLSEAFAMARNSPVPSAYANEVKALIDSLYKR